MARKSTCKKKHIEELADREMGTFIYRYSDDIVWLDPISIWDALRKAGALNLANELMKGVAIALDREVEKKKKEKEDC